MNEAIEILTREMNDSLHLALYPQDRDKEKRDLKALIRISEYHQDRANGLKEAIQKLKGI